MNSERNIAPEGVIPVRMAVMKPSSVQVGRVDYVKGNARLRIYFYEKNAPHNFSDEEE